MSRKKVLMAEMAIILLVALIGMVILLNMQAPCAHGHHTGTCGRQYRHMIGKVSTISVCNCFEDHY
jgi:hypothetical protein